MRAVQFSKYGSPEVLHVVDVDEPHAGPGQVRIAVRAAGVNPSDWKRMAGKYRDHEEVTFPSGLGVEGSVQAFPIFPSQMPSSDAANTRWPWPNMRFSHAGPTSRRTCRLKLPVAFQ